VDSDSLQSTGVTERGTMDTETSHTVKKNCILAAVSVIHIDIRSNSGPPAGLFFFNVTFVSMSKLVQIFIRFVSCVP
jgi:hypothetical protein